MAADLYAMLGVSKEASDEEIKKAYRKKAVEYHPDRGGDEEKFKELKAAYEVLSNPSARSNYDRFGDPRGPVGAGGMSGDPFGGMGDLNDLIGMLFGQQGGGRGGRTRSNQGRDVIVETAITLEEAFSGVDKKVEVELERTCKTCSGSGGKDGAKPITCSNCHGAGSVQEMRQSLFGTMMTQVACPACHGAGNTIDKPCTDCEGEGRVVKSETITVRIPSGIDNGRRIRVAGRGEAGRQGAPAGDLFVSVGVLPHETFVREGTNLHSEMNISMIQAALGDTIDLTMLDGEKLEIKVPAGSQYGDIIKIRHKGMPRLGADGAQRGTLHVHCKIHILKDLKEEDREALQGIAERNGTKIIPGNEGKGFFARLKDAFDL